MTQSSEVLTSANVCQASYRGTVLIVDDVIEAAEELSEALEEFGVDARIAETAEQAKEMILQQPEISAVVTDFYLSGYGNGRQNGLSLLDELNALVPDRKLDTIVVSGDPDVLVDCTLMGAQTFLSKPLAPESLLAVLSVDLPEPVSEGEATVRQLHQVIMTQSEAITQLTETIKQYEKRAVEISTRVDHVTSAAILVSNSVVASGNEDVVNLTEYIVAEGAAAKDLADNRYPGGASVT